MSIQNNSAGLQRILQAVNDLPDAAPAGVTVQKKTGTFTTNSSGTATVTCGFKPDVVAFDVGEGHNEYNFSGLMFAEANATQLEAMTLPADASKYLFSGVIVNITETGFSVTSTNVDYDFEASNDSNRTLSYTALKYT